MFYIKIRDKLFLLCYSVPMTAIEITIYPRRITFRHSDGRTGGDPTPTSLVRGERLAYYYQNFAADRVFVRVETEVFTD